MSTDALADECEAFLHGRLVDHYRAAGEVVPSWAWLNKLAHATPEELALIADGRELAFGSDPEMSSWNQAAVVVAEEVLERAEQTGLRVRAVQLLRLVPFELAAAGNKGGYPMTPQLLVSVTRAVLHGHPSVQSLFF